MQFHCIYTLKCSFQSAGRFIAARLTAPLLFWISLSKAFTNTVHSSSDERRYFIASKIWYRPLCAGGGVILSTSRISGVVWICTIINSGIMSTHITQYWSTLYPWSKHFLWWFYQISFFRFILIIWRQDRIWSSGTCCGSHMTKVTCSSVALSDKAKYQQIRL